MSPAQRLLLPICLFALSAHTLLAQSANVAEAEVQKCEDKIGSVQRDVLGKYDDILGEMQLTLQKAADLEGALAVRTERERLKKEHTLSDGDLVSEPKVLRALQTQYLAKQLELVGQLIRETVPRLLEYKKALTVAGKLDEAVAVRTAIENLQNNHLPVVKPEAAPSSPWKRFCSPTPATAREPTKSTRAKRSPSMGSLAGTARIAADAKSLPHFPLGSTRRRLGAMLV